MCGEYGPWSKKFTEFIIVELIFNRNEVYHMLSLTIAKNALKRKKTKTTGSDLNLQLIFRVKGILKPSWKSDWLKRLRPKSNPKKRIFAIVNISTFDKLITFLVGQLTEEVIFDN
jgi:hypothetical protein